MPGALKFRPVTPGLLGKLLGTLVSSEWPAWVRALSGKSGVYVIRATAGHAVLYVGESHTGRLYDTLTRHFQAWSGQTAGPTYRRGSVEIAVVLVAKTRVVAIQDKLICRLQPRDNTVSPVCPLKPEHPF